MLRIECPFCGERDYTEFRYGGDARRERPAHGSADPKVWYDYVFLFENPKGLHQEYWQHVLGCRQWLVLERSTATNHIGPSWAARDPGRTAEAMAVGEAVTK
jgi:heterotetrameric sarcosine oxidase delta subunit